MHRRWGMVVAALLMVTGCSSGHASSKRTAQDIFRVALANLDKEPRVRVVIGDKLAPSGLSKVDASFHDGEVNLVRTYPLGSEHVRVVGGFASVYSPRALLQAWYPRQTPEWLDYNANRWVNAGADGAKQFTLSETVSFMNQFSISPKAGYSKGTRDGHPVYVLTVHDVDRGEIRMDVAVDGNPRLLHTENVTGTFTEDFTQYGTTPPVPPPREGVAP
ncbi:MAG TPA: hypothetical protein VHZ96_27775 [Frankiaceae bacterium]|nr:hypothetical protein [Frankiaceae bacterium]